MARITIASIRARYPHPVAFADSARTKRPYCVGGALVKSLGYKASFPVTESLARYLIEANSKLSLSAAITYAEKIIVCSDDGNFEMAWSALGLALKNRGEKKVALNASKQRR